MYVPHFLKDRGHRATRKMELLLRLDHCGLEESRVHFAEDVRAARLSNRLAKHQPDLQKTVVSGPKGRGGRGNENVAYHSPCRRARPIPSGRLRAQALLDEDEVEENGKRADRASQGLAVGKDEVVIGLAFLKQKREPI